MASRPRSALSVSLVVLFYGGMAALAWLLAYLFGVPSLWHRPPSGPLHLPVWAALAGGIGLGLLAHLGGVLAEKRFPWARNFYERLAELIGSATTVEVVVAAAASGIAEELLFRGALLPIIGLVPQAIVFGLMHIGPGKAFRFWPLYAAAMGILFGLLYQSSGLLLATVLAHFTVNYFGLSAISRRRSA